MSAATHFSHFTLADGTPQAYTLQGEGADVVLISGLGGMAEFWQPVLAGLPACRALRYDQRGTGLSGRPDAPISVAQLADDLRQLLDHCGMQRAALVGHSTGGAIAQALALAHPERVSHLVLSSTWSRPTPYFQALFEMRRELLTRAGPELYARLQALISYPPAWLDANPALLRPAARSATQGNDNLTAARIDALQQFDLHTALPAITAPSLVLTCADDVVVPPGMSESLAAQLPNASTQVWARGGHFHPRTETARFAAAVREFLQLQAPLTSSINAS